VDQEQVMADTMPPAAAIEVPQRDQRRGFSRITQRDGVGKPAANTAFARLAKGLTLAFAMIAGISAAPGSGSANENPIGASNMPLILADPTEIQTVDPDPITRFHGKAYRQLGAEPVPIPHPNASAPSGRPGRGGLGVPALPNLRRLGQ
jgi:hypothetical protein